MDTMGNDKRHPDRVDGWGSAERKENSKGQKHQHEAASIEDELDPKPTPAATGKRRGSRHWCRRKEGREHVWAKQDEPIRHYWRHWDIFICSACGKKRYEAR